MPISKIKKLTGRDRMKTIIFLKAELYFISKLKIKKWSGDIFIPAN